ncbi:MAG: c-type cytochrome [Caulobacterales bacterium]|nr:c-type cytochrome [Caulobacterales bacterium]
MSGKVAGAITKRTLAAAVAMLSLGVVLVAGMAQSQAREGRLLRLDPDARLAPDQRTAALAAGRRVFRAQCAGCHGPDGRGDTGYGAPNLADRDWLYGTGAVGEIEQTIAYGIRSHQPKGWNLADMPAFGAPRPSAKERLDPLSPGDIGDVIAFLSARRGATASAEAVARGRAIYQGRGGCYDCHGGDAAGDPAIGAPNLIDAVWLYGDGSPPSVFRSIAQGRRGVMPGFAGRLSAVQLRQVSLYVKSLSEAP